MSSDASAARPVSLCPTLEDSDARARIGVDRRHLALCEPACDCFPQQLAIAGRNPKQLSHPQDEVRLELVHHEVDHGDFPQHLDDLLAAILIELGAKDAGEPVKIDGDAVVADYRLANEPARFIVAKPEMRLQQSVELAALFVGNLSVDLPGRGRATLLRPAAIPPRANSPRVLQGE